MAFPKGNVFSGPRARFYIGTTVVGYATSCAGSEELQYEAVETLDHLQVIEFVPVAYRCTFTAARVRLIGNAAAEHGSLRGQLGVFPKLGNSDADLLTNTLNIGDDLTCMIEDTRSGKRFMQLENVKVTTRGWAITPRGLVGEDIGFLATRMLDETEAL